MPESLVLELQQLASESNERLPDLLRKALIVATKLGLNDFRVWIDRELNGYGTSSVPEYRIRSSQYHVSNPYHGLQPLTMPDSKTQKAFCELGIRDSVEALRHVIDQQGKSGGNIYCSIRPETELSLRQAYECLDLPLVRTVSPSDFSAILDAVRTKILEWALKLEQEGIFGNGMSFSADEKQKAQASTVINIGTFSGILGTVSGGHVSQNIQANVQENDFGSLEKALAEIGVAGQDVGLLKKALTQDPHPASPEKFGPKVGKWLGNMVQKAAEGGLKISGSSGFSGKGLTDSQEEVLVISESVGHSLDDLNRVVKALQDAGVERIVTVR